MTEPERKAASIMRKATKVLTELFEQEEAKLIVVKTFTMTYGAESKKINIDADVLKPAIIHPIQIDFEMKL